jgi:hypothetical protein
MTEGVCSVIHTDAEGAQRVIALDVAEGYADLFARILNLLNGHGVDADEALIVTQFSELLERKK